MRRFVLWGVVILLGAAVALAVLALSTRLLAAPLHLHAWWPVPVACVGSQCISYRHLASTIASAHLSETPEQILTRLLTQKALARVARRHSIFVSNQEVQEALQTIARAADQTPALRTLVQQTYGATDTPRLREGLRELLLASKLRAAGIEQVWANAATPSVMVLSARYRWDAQRAAVVEW